MFFFSPVLKKCRGDALTLLPVFLPLALCPFLVPPLHAQKPEQQGPPPGWSLGLGVVHITQPYRGIDDRVLPIPFVSYRSRFFFFQGPTAGVQLPLSRLVTIGAKAQYKFGAYDPDDSDFLRGMEERDDTVDAGGFIKIRIPGGFSLEAEVLSDTLGRHKGREWEVSAGRRFRLDQWMLIPSVGVKWESSRFADYYYGVQPHEAAPGRPAYQVPGAVNYEAGFLVSRQLSEKWSGVLLFKATRLDDDIEQSPIVDTRTVFRTILSATRRFN